MAEYLLELYAPIGATNGAGSVRDAVDVVAARGKDVQYLRSMYVEAEETCFVLLEAETSEAAQEVARLADVPSDRVNEVATDPGSAR
jgi:hypothetical protein